MTTDPAPAAPVVPTVDKPISPSSLELWLRCQRWWGFQYIEGLRAPSGDKANIGTRCHTIAERYLRDGEAPNHAEKVTINIHGSPRVYYPGRIVANILHHLPPAGSVRRTEERSDFRYKGIEFTGIIDWQTPETIGDHKFTSDLMYAKAERDLVRDPQAVLYRTNRWLESDQRTCTLQWTYGQMDAKASKVVRLPVVREFESIDRFMPTVEGMLKARSTVKEANALPATGLTLRPQIACEMYGGCPHTERCNRNAIQVHKHKLGAYMTSSVLDRLRARAKEGAPHATPATVVHSATNGSATPSNGAPAPAPSTVAGSVNPPGEAHVSVPSEPQTTAPAASAQSQSVPATDPVVPRKRGRPRKYPVDPPTATTAPVAPTVTTTAPVAPTPAVATTTGAPVSDVAPTTTAETPTAEAAVAQPPTIGVLYVNCRPVRGDVTLCEGSELIAAAHRLVCEDQNVAHYKFMPYGSGAGALSVALGVVLADRGFTPAVYVDTRSTVALDTIQVFSVAAEFVVVGQ